MLSAQPLRHTSLKTRVRFCAVYPSYLLWPSTLSCLIWRPESGFILILGLPFEGSGWATTGFGLIFQILFRALRRQARGPCAAFVCVLHLYRGFEGWYYVFLGYWDIWRLLTIESVKPVGAWVFRLYTLGHYVSKTIVFCWHIHLYQFLKSVVFNFLPLVFFYLHSRNASMGWVT